MPVRICSLDPELCRPWDAYVRRHPIGSPFHLVAWKSSIEKTFGYQSCYLMAMNGDDVVGVLPLFLIRNMIVGKALISSPFAVYGGILADDPSIQRALYDHATELGERHKVQYIEFRNADLSQCVGQPNVSRYVRFAREVSPGDETLMGTLPKKTRNLVRKALKSPYQVRIKRNDCDGFERLYSMNMRRLGTPSFPRRHFENLITDLGDGLDIREYYVNDKLAAASMNLFFGSSMHTYYAASDPSLNAHAPNVFMYYNQLQWCSQNGYQVFDFGRCKRDTGVFEFKSHWAATPCELPYEIVLVERKDVPNFSPTNHKFNAAIRIWRSLPLPLTRTLGPQIVRLFP